MNFVRRHTNQRSLSCTRTSKRRSKLCKRCQHSCQERVEECVRKTGENQWMMKTRKLVSQEVQTHAGKNSPNNNGGTLQNSEPPQKRRSSKDVRLTLPQPQRTAPTFRGYHGHGSLCKNGMYGCWSSIAVVQVGTRTQMGGRVIRRTHQQRKGQKRLVVKGDKSSTSGGW